MSNIFTLVLNSFPAISLWTGQRPEGSLSASIAPEGLFDGLFEQGLARVPPPFPASSRFGQAVRGVGDLVFSGRLSA